MVKRKITVQELKELPDGTSSIFLNNTWDCVKRPDGLHSTWMEGYKINFENLTQLEADGKIFLTLITAD